MEKTGLKINGHIGTWYVVDTHIFRGEQCYELEHEEFGSDAAHIIVDPEGNVLVDDVWDGFLNLKEKYGELGVM
ncbi:hypothetical protein ACV7JQ_09215 [Globicatella sulfidifaciens]